jgi:zinc transport system permease protein
MIEALQYAFMQRALIVGILASITCGVIGVYVVVNRMVFISGGISHASFGGVGLGFLSGIDPVLGAMLFAIASALGIGTISRRTKLPIDTAIGVLWTTGMALGVIFIALTPGYTPDITSYLFGNILLVSSRDVILMIILATIIVSVVILLYKEFLVLSFDEEFGKVSGLPTDRLYFLLLCLIALSVIVLMRAVGIILVIALLTIPAAISRQFTHSLKKMMLLSIFLGAIFVISGLWLSYELDIASGATIILVSGTLFLASLGFSKLRSERLPKPTGKLNATPGS